MIAKILLRGFLAFKSNEDRYTIRILTTQGQVLESTVSKLVPLISACEIGAKPGTGHTDP
jgi:hypothetical protein